MSEGQIFIVDDNPHNLALLSGILHEAGYEVRAANSGRRALQMAERQPPELILLDISMPEIDGYEVCRRLKLLPQLAPVPVIFVSALDDVLDKVRAFSAGGVDYVSKPFHAEEVLARVSAQLRLARLQSELARRNAMIEEQNRELERQKAALVAANEELARLSATDHLTGLPNRRRFIELMEAEIALADRHDEALALVMFDVDHFKAVNDTYGHDAGDAVLRHVAATVQSGLRASDVVARWGGEEFMVMLRRSDGAAAHEIAEKLRARLAASPVEPAGDVTASFGATQYRRLEGFARLAARADELVYRAKTAGRNRVAAE